MCGGGVKLHPNCFSQRVKRACLNVLFVMAGILMINLSSCQSLDDINDRLDKVEGEVSDLNSTVKALQDAYGQAKIIRSILPLEDGTRGWLITFTDNTDIKFVEGIVADVAKDEATGVITISLNDGRSFWFNTHYVSPTSIAILRTRPIELSCGSRDTIEFRLNPSNASFKMTGDECQIELDKIGNTKTRSSYITTPSYYKLVGVEQVCDETTKEVKIGQYRAIIEDTQNSAEYDDMSALVMNVEDTNGDIVQISSSAFEVKGQAVENMPKTGLPIVIINTPNSNSITSKENWMEGATMTIVKPDMTYDYIGTLSIKGRGNSTWIFPKKPYALKLDKKDKILGMKKHKRWCLLANWADRTLMRNAVAFEIAKKCKSLEWTPSGHFVELIFNGYYAGNYFLCEQIKVDENRVNIAELDPKATEGEGITGGYLMELDHYFDETFKFRSSIKNFPWQFKDPDEVNEYQYNYMVDFVNKFEKSLYDNYDFPNDRSYAEYIDIDSYIDWWFVNELTMNGESAGPKSVYMYKDKNKKMKAGPAWDYDIMTFIPERTSFFRSIHHLYYDKLFEDPIFVSRVKEKWNEEKTYFMEVVDTIEELHSYLQKSQKNNFDMWPCTWTENGDNDMPYDVAVERLKQSYIDKLNWMNQQIQNF